MVNPPEVDRLPPLKVRDLRLDIEQISADFGLKRFETGSLVAASAQENGAIGAAVLAVNH